MLESYVNLERGQGLLKCLEFFQPLLCLYQAMQTRKKFSIGLNDDYGPFLSLYFTLSALFRCYLFGAFNIDAMFAPN